MQKTPYPRFLIVKDNFYDNPEQVLKAAQLVEYYEPEYITGYRSYTVYHPPHIRQKLEKIIGIKITRWDIDPLEENGVFYQGFSKGKKKETPGVHSDLPHDDITVLVYLTPDLPLDTGTSLWMHKATGLTDAPNSADARKLKTSLAALRQTLEEDSAQRSKWIEIDRAGNRFNRMVAYPSGALHSATKHFGSNIHNGRLYQTFRIGVDWSTFKMAKA
jgi:Family of unknown function (DUF6445)